MTDDVKLLQKALVQCISDVKKLERTMPDAGPEGPPGPPGEPGPTLEQVVEKVLALIPEQQEINYTYLIDTIKAQVPPGRDGVPGPKGDPGPRGDSPCVADVATTVLNRLEARKRIPTAEAIAKKVRAAVKNGQDGKPGRDGKPGKDGKDGDSVVDAEIVSRDLILYVGKQRKRINAGEVVPRIQTRVGGGGSVRAAPVSNVNSSEAINVVVNMTASHTLLDNAYTLLEFNNRLEDDNEFFNTVSHQFAPTDAVPRRYYFKPTVRVNSGTPSNDCRYTYALYKNGSLYQIGSVNHIFQPDPEYRSDFFTCRLDGVNDYAELYMLALGDAGNDHIALPINSRMEIWSA